MHLETALQRLVKSEQLLVDAECLVKVLNYITQAAGGLPEPVRAEFFRRCFLILLAMRECLSCWCCVHQGRLQAWHLVKEAFKDLETPLRGCHGLLEESPNDEEDDDKTPIGIATCIMIDKLIDALAMAVFPGYKKPSVTLYDSTMSASPKKGQETEEALDVLVGSVSVLKYGLELTKIIDQIEVNGRSLPDAMRYDFFRRNGLLLMAMQDISVCWCAFRPNDESQKKGRWDLLVAAFDGLPSKYLRGENGFLVQYDFDACVTLPGLMGDLFEAFSPEEK